jgi:hypothetical protein
MLDNNYMYRLGSTVDLSALAVADHVTVELENLHGHEIVTKVVVLSPLRLDSGSAS